jgi:hypothetical protein
MILTVETILKLTGCAALGFRGALPALRGRVTYILEDAGEAKGDIPTKTVPYDIEPRARWYCEMLNALLEPHAAAFEQIRKTLIDRYEDGEDKNALITLDIQSILQQRVSLLIKRELHFSDLKPDRNAIPPDVLLVLAQVAVDTDD